MKSIRVFRCGSGKPLKHNDFDSTHLAMESEEKKQQSIGRRMPFHSFALVSMHEFQFLISVASVASLFCLFFCVAVQFVQFVVFHWKDTCRFHSSKMRLFGKERSNNDALTYRGISHLLVEWSRMNKKCGKRKKTRRRWTRKNKKNWGSCKSKHNTNYKVNNNGFRHSHFPLFLNL